MKKRILKTLAYLVIIQMVFNCMLIGKGYAENPSNTSFTTAEPLSLNTPVIVNIISGGTKLYYSFSPSSTGFYLFQSSNNNDSDPRGGLYNEAHSVLSENDDWIGSDWSGDENYRIVYHLEEGATYYIESGCYSTGIGSYTLTVVNCNGLTGYYTAQLTQSNNSTVNVDEEYKRDVFVIHPQYTGLYTIESIDDDYDPCAWLYNSSGVLVAQNDDYLVTDYNFRIDCALTEGEDYYIVCGCYEEDLGTYEISLDFVIPTQPTDLTVNNTTGNSTYLTWSTGSSGNVDRWLVQKRVSNGNWINVAAPTTNHYTVMGLQATTSYEFRVYGEVGAPAWSGARSAPSNTASVTTLPAQPTSVIISDVTGNSLKLTWSTVSPHGADRWLIQYKVGNGSWTNLGRTTSKWYNVTDLTANTNYQFRVYSEAGNTPWYGTWSIVSDTVSTTTLPAQPTDLTISNLTGNSLKLAWSTVSPHGADRWLIQYKVGNGSWTNLGRTTSKWYNVTDLTANTNYQFRVYSEAGNTPWYGTWSIVSNIVSTTTLPAQPTNLTVSNLTGNSLKLAWSTVSPHGADRWLIQYKVGNGSWTNLGRTTSKWYNVTNLTASTNYQFRVYSEAGNTPWYGTWSIASNTVSTTTLPAQPTGLAVINVTNSTASLTWNTVSPHGADRWLIQYRIVGGNWQNAGTSTSKNYTVTSLNSNTQYEFRVYSERGGTKWGGVWSIVSNTASATTTNNNLTASELQTAFYNSPRGGDWDGVYGLQCVDLYRWFIETYTSLTSTSGNGKDCAYNLAVANNLTISSTPTPYSVFSVAGNVVGFGSTGTPYGHTGIVISVNTTSQTCIVLHTGNSLTGANPNSWVSEYSYNMSGLSFVDIGAYLN